MKLNRDEKLVVLNSLNSKYKEVEKLMSESNYSDYKSLYFDWLMEIDRLVEKFKKELFNEKENT